MTVIQIIKRTLKTQQRKQAHQFKKWAKDLNKNFTKENVQMENKHMKRCSTSHHQM